MAFDSARPRPSHSSKSPLACLCRCILRTDANWDGIAFCRSFDTEAGKWQTLRLPFTEFKPVFRAKTLTDGTKLDPSSVSSVQLMLSKCELLLSSNPTEWCSKVWPEGSCTGASSYIAFVTKQNERLGLLAHATVLLHTVEPL